ESKLDLSTDRKLARGATATWSHENRKHRSISWNRGRRCPRDSRASGCLNCWAEQRSALVRVVPKRRSCLPGVVCFTQISGRKGSVENTSEPRTGSREAAKIGGQGAAVRPETRALDLRPPFYCVSKSKTNALKSVGFGVKRLL